MIKLSRNECNAMRGIAILGIFLHNYCHWLGTIVKENEYQFMQYNVSRLVEIFTHPDIRLPMHLVSFFGHYGVPVFLFLSAYGLYMKYEKGDVGIGKASFIGTHFRKLFRMMIIGFALFTAIDAITPGAHHYKLTDIVAQLALVNNLLPTPDKIIWPGPYWFFGLMLQLYVVYRLFLFRRHWCITLILMTLCTLLQMCCAPEGETLNRLRYNFIGGMLPFGMGLLYARYADRHELALRTSTVALVALVSIALVVMMSFHYITWYFVPIAVIIASIAIVRLMKGRLLEWLEWTGGISAALFVTHPITRKIFIPISRHGDEYAGLILYIIASILLAMAINSILKRR